jgi:acetyltransferase-like isoleucine patch superfamily enzyme/acyl carrier protein
MIGQIKHMSSRDSCCLEVASRMLAPVFFSIRVLLWPVLAGIVTGAFVQWIGLAHHLAIWQWGFVVPIIYYIWLLLMLGGNTLETTLLKTQLTKPRRVVVPPGVSPFRVPMAPTLYARMHTLATLPGSASLKITPGLRWLWFRSYATSVHLAHSSLVNGSSVITDPDLTHVGKHSLIGESSRLVAHVIVWEPSGEMTMQTAPIVIGDHVTIGGSSLIELGVTIGDGSLIERRSFVPAFTRIPAGEVWGGSPAVFRRKRESKRTAALDVGSTEKAAPSSDGIVYALVAGALNVPPETIHATSGSATCEFWDSLGKMAIAAELESRLGITIDAQEIFELNSMADVLKVVHARDLIAKTSPSTSSNGTAA